MLYEVTMMGFGTRIGATRRRGFVIRALVAMAVAVGLTGAVPMAYADEVTTNPEYTAALERLNSLSDQYGALASAQDETYAQLEEIRSKISDAQAQMESVQQEVDVHQAALNEKRAILADQIAVDYKSGGVSLLSILLSSSSFEDAISKVYYHGIVCQTEADKIAAVNTAKAELENRQIELKKLENELSEEEASIAQLYDQQRAQADAMYAQQVEAAELLSSLPKELQSTLDTEGSELISESQAVVEANEEQKQAEEAEQQSQTSDTTNESTSNGSSSNSNGSQSSETNNTNTNNTNNTSNTNTNNTTSTQETSGASGSQQAVLNAAYSNNGSEALSKGWGCAGWVYCVFRDSGVYDRKPSCAAWYYNNWCYTSDRSQIQPGMVVAISTWTGTAAGRIYGHVGIYVGNNTVRHLSAGAVRNISLDDWINRYGTTVTPMWGWNGGIALS